MINEENTSCFKRALHAVTPKCVVKAYRQKMEHKAWAARGFASPSTPDIKRAVLLREGLTDATWVETGTYLGETTELLSQTAKRVHTIEVAPKLAERAQKLFENVENITVWQGDSASVLTEVMTKLSGNVNFWLDGHFSGTFTGKGETGDTPIVEELEIIEKYITEADSVNFVVMVDDVRCFGMDSAYPELNFLADWAAKNAKEWHIEHDIFIARIEK